VRDKKQLGSGYLKRAIMPPSSNFIKTPHRETTTDPPLAPERIHNATAAV